MPLRRRNEKLLSASPVVTGMVRYSHRSLSISSLATGANIMATFKGDMLDAPPQTFAVIFPPLATFSVCISANISATVLTCVTVSLVRC